MPEDAKPVAVMAAGHPDYPNQINNVPCFPGIFRGASACRAYRMTKEMKLAATVGLLSLITNSITEYIIPSVFDKRVVEGLACDAKMRLTGAA